MDRVDRFVENIGNIRKLEAEMTGKMHQLKRYYVPEEEMLPLACRVFEIAVTADVIHKQKRVDDLIALRGQISNLTTSYFSTLGPHGYAALNVLTDYASRPVGVMAPESSMHSLQQKAGRWMDEFISAIEHPTFSFDTYLADFRQTADAIQAL